MKITKISLLKKSSDLEEYFNPRGETIKIAKEMLLNSNEILLVKAEGSNTYANLLRTNNESGEQFSEIYLEDKYEDDSLAHREEKKAIEALYNSINTDLEEKQKVSLSSLSNIVMNNEEVMGKNIKITDEEAFQNMQEIYSGLSDVALVFTNDERKVIDLGSFFDEAIIHKENTTISLGDVKSILMRAKETLSQQEENEKTHNEEFILKIGGVDSSLGNEAQLDTNLQQNI